MTPCIIAHVVIELSTPRVDDLDGVVSALREWQDDVAPMQLHPGDLGWFWQFGAEATAAALRVWTQDEQLLAVGFLDGPEQLRLTVAPEVRHDEVLAGQLVTDLADPERGVLPAGKVAVETPNDTLVQQRLTDSGWDLGESCIAAATALQKLGASSVQVCTESARVAAVATYESAGFERLPLRLDRSRDA